MKSTLQRVLFAAAVAALGAGAVGTASAQTSSAPGATPPNGGHHGHFRHFGGGQFVGSLLRATRQLNLSTQQQSDIKSILTNARHDHQGGSDHPALTVMGNPSDPGFASAVQGAAANASNQIQRDSALAGQIYGVLTPQQQKLLPSVLASIQAKEQARRAAWAAKHAAGNG
jgi:Spy/CpxP family protein refolding chaperone